MAIQVSETFRCYEMAIPYRPAILVNATMLPGIDLSPKQVEPYFFLMDLDFLSC